MHLLRNALRFSLALVVISGCYWAYAATLARWLQPNTAWNHVEVEDYPLVTEGIDLSAYFPPDAWELDVGRVTVVQMRYGYLVFRDFEQTPGKLRVQPVSLVFLGDQSQAERKETDMEAVVLRAPEGALLDLPTDSEEPGGLKTPTSGRLLGEIQIEQVAAATGKPPLRCTTRNLQITPERIWTAADVSFSWGQSSGSGRELTIDLQTDAYDRSAGAASYAGIQSVSLRQVDHLTLDLADQRLLRPEASPAAPAALGPVDADGVVDIRCQGQFRLDLRRNVAFFEKDVQVRRLLAGAAAETLLCNHLELHFHHPRDQKPLRLPAADAANNQEAAAAKLQLVRIQAVGYPVQLSAAADNVEVRGELLRYDLETNLLLLDGERVTLQQGDQIVTAASIEYELRREALARAGKLWAHGPGVIEFAADANRPRVQAAWKDVLQLQPQDGEHVLSLQSGAEVRIEGFGEFSAEQLHVYLRELPVAAPQVRRLGAAVQQPPSAPPPARWKLTPDRMLATGGVRIASPYVQGVSRECRVWFTQAPSGADAARSPLAGRAERSSDPASRNPLLDNWQGPPLELSAGMIQAQVSLSGKQPQVIRASLHDRVSLKRRSAVARDNWELAGDVLEYRAAKDEATLVGQPARLQSQGAMLEGPRIAVFPSANTLRMESGGLATIVLSEGMRPSEIRWQGLLHFDGRAATINEAVQFRGEQRQSNGQTLRYFGRSHQLAVELAQAVAWKKAAGPSGNGSPEIARFALRAAPQSPDDQVYLETALFGSDESQVSYDRVRMREVAFEKSSGEIHGVGPGETSTTRVGGLQLPSLDPTLGRFATRRPEAKAPPLTYLQVKHDGPLHGNLQSGYLRVEQGVQATLSPVQRWDERVAVQRRSDMSDKMAVLYCQQLTVSQAAVSANGQRQMHLQADGNAQIVGRMFSARTNRLSFDQSKDLVILEGDGRDGAELQIHRDPNAEPQSLRAGRFLFWPKTLDFRMESGRGFSTGPLTSNGPP